MGLLLSIVVSAIACSGKRDERDAHAAESCAATELTVGACHSSPYWEICRDSAAQITIDGDESLADDIALLRWIGPAEDELRITVSSGGVSQRFDVSDGTAMIVRVWTYGGEDRITARETQATGHPSEDAHRPMSRHTLEVWAGPQDDVITGARLVYGGDGHDVIHGTDERDELHGNGGPDEIHGEGGPDDLYGGGADDELHGGSGRDELHGGGGTDQCDHDDEDGAHECELELEPEDDALGVGVVAQTTMRIGS
ncbi:MAG: hypothetical protein KDK70_00090 [Myxococcales bacterium]|nr:hypothetical protein [Myxococcales bacterium]